MNIKPDALKIKKNIVVINSHFETQKLYQENIKVEAVQFKNQNIWLTAIAFY